MKLCFFGMYNKNYARTSTLREGLLRLGLTVCEIHEEVPNERMELPEDFTFSKTIHRILRKIACFVRLVLRSGKVRGAQAIVVLHPGHLELPFVYLLAKITHIPLLFDSSISPYDTMFVGRFIADRRSLKAKIVKVVETILLRLPDKIFVDNDRMGDFLTKQFGVPKQKLFSVPLGANDSIYHPSETEVNHTEIHVLFFGLYNPMHGAPTILEAAKLLASNQQISFTLLGDGYLKEEFISFAKKNNLKNVKFVGFVPEVELVKYIQRADILLGVFSRSPIFERVIPNKVFAALACKKAVITADLTAVSSFFKHGKDIVLCSPEDSQGLADAISDLAGSRKKREEIAAAGHDRYLHTGTPQAIAKKFLRSGLGVAV